MEDQPDRRGFLKWISVIGGVITGALAGVPSLVALISPGFKGRSEENWIELGEAEFFDWEIPIRVDVPETVRDAWDERRVVQSVWIWTDDGENFRVYHGRCTHLSCAYHYMEEEEYFFCPCHQGIYDGLTGEVIGGPPPRALDTLESRVDADGILRVRYQNFLPGIAEKKAL
jgi:Rieske Fe-S protein